MLNKEHILMIPMFQGLKKSTLDMLEQSANICTLSKGEILFRERDKIDTVYIILNGKVTMYRNNAEGHKKVVYILDNGQIINEVIFDGLSASINCEAFEKTELLWFNREKFLDIMSKDFDLTKKVIDMMAKKIRRLYR